MKKSLIYLAAIAALVACSKAEVKTDTIDPSQPTEEVRTITLTGIVPGDDSDTKVTLKENVDGSKTTLKVAWEADDAIAVTYKDDKEEGGIGSTLEFKASNAGSSSEFTASGKTTLNLDDGDVIYACYPYSTITKTGVSIDLSEQKGTLEWCAENAPMFATAEYKENGTSLEFKNKAAIIKISLTLPEGDKDYDITSLTLITTNKDLVTKGTVGLNGTWTADEETGSIKINFDSQITLSALEAKDVYVVVPAQTTKSVLKIVAGKYTAQTKSTSITLSEGNYYRLSPTLQSNNIEFKDDNVKAICIANWDTDGDGELSYDEAAKVTDLGTVFKENREITSFEELRYFTGLTAIGDLAFAGCYSLNSITLPSTVTTIGESAFRGCLSLHGITLPSTVTTIKGWAFDGCQKLGSITLPEGLTTIEVCAFHGCYSLESITLPSTVTTIGAFAFEDCENLNSITLPEGLKTIEENAFLSCKALESITLPESLETIDQYAFDGCSELSTVYCKATTPPTMGQHVFLSCESLANIYVPSDYVNDYKKADGWSDYTDIISEISE